MAKKTATAAIVPAIDVLTTAVKAAVEAAIAKIDVQPIVAREVAEHVEYRIKTIWQWENLIDKIVEEKLGKAGVKEYLSQHVEKTIQRLAAAEISQKVGQPAIDKQIAVVVNNKWKWTQAIKAALFERYSQPSEIKRTEEILRSMMKEAIIDLFSKSESPITVLLDGVAAFESRCADVEAKVSAVQKNVGECMKRVL